MPHCRVLPAGIFSDMSSQSDVSHFNMLPLGEFTVMIPEPHATLQGAATWRIHCHDSSATFHIAGCKNSICHIDNRFLPYFIFFCFLNAVWALATGSFHIISHTLVVLYFIFIVFQIVYNLSVIHCLKLSSDEFVR